MSREVELERPARVEQPRERVLQKPAASNGPELGGDDEEEVLLEKEEQCVCQICTCGKHRCRSASTGFFANDAQETLQQRARTSCEKEAGRRQWEVSPDTVRQISKSYRSIERQDDASETTTVCEQRIKNHERASESKVFHSDAIATGGRGLGHEGRAQTGGGVVDGLSYEQAVMREDVAATHLVQSSEFAAHEAEERTKLETRHCHHTHHHHDHHDLHSSSGRGEVQGRVSSLYRPRTSLRLEGPGEYITTSSDYFSKIDQNPVSRAEQYRLERQDVAAAATAAASTDAATAAAAAAATTAATTAAAATADTDAATARSGLRHYPLTRPQTSLRTGGKTHYSTTTGEDFKHREQTDKVTRRLRPRKFDDPSYDSLHADVETDVKKRRTEMEAEDQASADAVQEERERKAIDEVAHGREFREDRGKAATQEVFQGHQFRGKEAISTEAQALGEAHLEARHDHRATSTYEEARDEFEAPLYQDAERPRPVDRPSTMANAEAYYRPEMSIPFYPKDNLAVSSGQMDLRTTNDLEFYKKKMERVRPVKPKSLSKLFGSNGSSSEGDTQMAASRRLKEHSVGKSSRVGQNYRVEKLQAAGLSSTYEDSKMHLGANNVLIKRRSKGQRKAHFEDDSVRWEGPGTYSTTTKDSYKKPESTHANVALCRRPQSHDVFHRFTQTGDELRRIKGKKKDADEITMFGRKDSAELIAEIQGLLGASGSRRSENKATKQDASARKKGGVESTSKKERAVQAVQADSCKESRQGAHERQKGQDKVKGAKKHGHQKAHFAEQEPIVANGESTAALKKRSAEISVDQRKTEMRIREVSAGQQEYLESAATARNLEAVHQIRAKTEHDVHRSEEIIVEGNEAQGYFGQGALSSEAQLQTRKSAETAVECRQEASRACPHVSSANRERLRFSTTTSDSFKDVSEKIQPAKPFYPKPNLAPEGSMSFETVHHGEFTPKTVDEMPTPVRPVSTLKLSDDTSYVTRNEDKIGYSKTAPFVGGTRYSVRKPESTLVLGQDSADYKTTSQLEYKALEAHELEDIYKKAVKVRRDRHRTYIRGQHAGAAGLPTGGAQQQRRRTSSGIEEVTTTSREAFKPVTVERPQPYRPQSCLKVRSAEDSYAEISTTMRDTFRRVTPTARVKPIKREASLKKLGDDTDYTPRKTTTGEAYSEVKIPPKPVAYRPTDNLKVTGGMTFSTTTQESYASRSSLQRNATEFVERAKPIKRDAVAKDIIFPVDSSGTLVQGGADYCSICKAEESAGVLRSLENTSSYARISKAPRERPRTHQKVGGGAFEHTTTSMAEYQDPRTQSWKQRPMATGRLVRTASAECPAAFLNTDRSEYVFKEVVGSHKFYLPAVQ
ncbi:uncharacterized protein LOC119442534 [Dermacentor silvarum]|uniref:uncharacterized protein LOC119442534 n=1 Tax=Dermacentor silvarum TaxID=543639 RepID=UPI00189B01A8|nr:uncharacterized protein LOC119442534 [Dermacentor silvarum]